MKSLSIFVWHDFCSMAIEGGKKISKKSNKNGVKYFSPIKETNN